MFAFVTKLLALTSIHPNIISSISGSVESLISIEYGFKSDVKLSFNSEFILFKKLNIVNLSNRFNYSTSFGVALSFS